MKFILTLTFVILCSRQIYAQDPQYSQMYANALYLCPAFAGAEENTRAIFATRYQWPGLDASFISNTFSVDHYIDRYKSGIGLIATSDFSTAAQLRSNEIGGIYAFHAELSKKIVFRPALQLSYVNRSLNFNSLTFGSQYTNNGYTGGPSNEPYNASTVSYLDISAGGILYSEKFWIGASTHHMNTPEQSFIHGQSELPMRISFFGGYKFSFTPEWKKRYVNPDEEKSITPTAFYKMQGKSDQLDIGLYGRYNILVIGMWYRGIPVKVFKPEKMNNEAIILLIGFIYKNVTMGYSYDYTISKLSGRSGGAHELTLSYSFKTKQPKRIQRRVVCPKF
ncbi:PorP/SprF family type IX secretion system membrane protein [Cytophaga aurantiaca]|uniref:PorP/SprF family type IX secretion system membrane protein n=1 Tax=Cytophaga aurantiaca TaxID=29530 RepID=UPI0012FBC7AF|nr:type IX secretion system membrane protein PorP/SprF [Cytophaga aurantiaca]